MVSTRTRKPLSDEQLEFFDREGYLVVDGVFTDADLQPLIDEISDEIDKRAAALIAEGKLSRDYREYDFAHRLAKISEETHDIARAIWNGTLATPAIFDIIRNPRLLDVAEYFCGEEIIASSVYRMRPKIPQSIHGPVPWHQDSGYVEPYCDKHLMLTVWLPLVDATEENGCMWVVPRAHKGEVLKHMLRHGKPYLIIPDDELNDLPKPVCVPVKKGGVLLLTNRTPHASFENNTDIVRWSMDLRYQSAALPTNAPISRLEGEIIGDAENNIPVACYPPEADFLVRSKARPNEVVTDPKVFNRIRTEHIAKPVTSRWPTVKVD